MKKNSQHSYSGGVDLQGQLMDAMARELVQEIDNEIMWNVMVENNADWHPVELKWNKQGDENYFWNEACAWAVENFGLPGDRYLTHPNERHMLFLFKHSEDAVLFSLRWV